MFSEPRQAPSAMAGAGETKTNGTQTNVNATTKSKPAKIISSWGKYIAAFIIKTQHGGKRGRNSQLKKKNRIETPEFLIHRDPQQSNNK